MAKRKKSKPANPRTPEQIAAIRRLIAHIVLAVIIVSVLSVGFIYTKRYVEKDVIASNDPPVVVLKNRPIWMSDFLADTIATSVRPDIGKSPMDHKLLVDAVGALRTNPWIKTVRQVRRVYTHAPGDTIEVDCEYRTPVALVKFDNRFTLVDADAVALPEQFSAQEVTKIMYGADGKVNIRMIDGVSRAPTAAGKTWPGDDLLAGIELVKLLSSQPFAEEILKINVANFQGRQNPKEAHVVLVTRYLSELRWGRPPSATDAFIEAKPEMKLAHMEQVYHQYKRIDANQPWLDLRFDHVVYPMHDSVSAHLDTNP